MTWNISQNVIWISNTWFWLFLIVTRRYDVSKKVRFVEDNSKSTYFSEQCVICESISMRVTFCMKCENRKIYKQKSIENRSNIYYSKWFNDEFEINIEIISFFLFIITSLILRKFENDFSLFLFQNEKSSQFEQHDNYDNFDFNIEIERFAFEFSNVVSITKKAKISKNQFSENDRDRTSTSRFRVVEKFLSFFWFYFRRRRDQRTYKTKKQFHLML